MNVIQCIDHRTSVRAYKPCEIPQENIKRILDSGIAAPSGKNGQPWRFFVVQKDKTLLRRLAANTIYSPFVEKADCLIFVFMDKSESYHYIKDAQAIGACIENMLLTAEELGIGACWVGEILKKDNEVKQILSLNNRYDLMAMIALGIPCREERLRTVRKQLEEVLIKYV